MENGLPVVYISILLLLLSAAAWAIFRQILKTRKIETTLGKLQNKLTKEKGTAQEYYELGSLYLDKRVYSQAIALFQKALKAEDLPEQESALVYNALGFAYFAQEQYDLAIRQYKEALKIDPTYVTALNNLGHAYERKQLTMPALEAYEQVLKLDPQNTTAKRRADSLQKRVVPST
ncbi:MAG: tetratricopeptide repeat protein [Leptolyngbyaceae cyanobacterium]|uniref:tetratricopeptide repeat protein n=1 Tax=Leptodesmis TaxID=2664261 RepID=UPI001F17B436|nr:tetratricopeptide repeat protein [Leptodesmis sichuanensis]MCA1994775.1 tetratricopeptide repeat protein [Coleofasciculus sp. S288]UIE38429.1 tetratricopeptide repeat protein [Leptodesmis sichuanensis A121]